MNTSKARGTRWESAIVTALQAAGWRYAERRSLNGAYDRGDITGIPGVVIEAKNHSRLDLAGWLDQALTEAANDSKPDQPSIGVAWFKRRGKSTADDGYVLMDGATFMHLLGEAGYL